MKAWAEAGAIEPQDCGKPTCRYERLFGVIKAGLVDIRKTA
jgi:hypothetical protein